MAEGEGGEGAGGEGAGGEGGEGAQGQGAGDGGTMSGAGTWAWNENTPGEGDRPEYLQQKYKTIEEQAKAYPGLLDLQSKWGNNFGAPDGDYELTLPEGVEGEFDSEDSLLTGFQETAKDLGLSQEAFDKIVHKYVENNADAVMTQAERVANVAAELGENGEQVMQDVWSRLSAVLPADQAEALDSVVSSAAGVKALQTLLTSEISLPSGDTGTSVGVTKDEARAMRSQTYPEGHAKVGRVMYGDDEAHTKKVDALYKQLYPGDDVQIVG